MKKVLLSLLIPLIIGSLSFGDEVDDEGLGVVNGTMLNLEANVKPSALSPGWSGLKSDWSKGIMNSYDAKTTGKLIVQFESNVKPSAFSARWKKNRAQWINKCSSASGAAQLAPLLLQLESGITTGSFSQEWKTKKGEWVSRLKSVK
jgi:hypothetical protein